MRCDVCGTENESNAIFCTKCTAPLNVVPLGEIDEAGRRICLHALWRVLGDSGLDPDAKTGPDARTEGSVPLDRDLWRRYLSAFWLRPETALWLYAEAVAIRSLSEFTGPPWLDLGCGDGVHTALYSGWQFDPLFDVFQCVDLDACDIYDHWDPVRFQAHVKTPGTRIAWGVDIKPTSVERARALGVFDKVVTADVCRLPLEDRCVRTVFCNMVGQLGELTDVALAECARATMSSGALLVSVLTPDFADGLQFLPASREAAADGDRALAQRYLQLDRGRHCFERQLPLSTWEATLGRHGFRVAAVRSLMSPPVVRFWDVGLRPFSPALIRQAEQWRKDGNLGAIKPALLSVLEAVLEPLRQRIDRGARRCVNVIAAVRE